MRESQNRHIEESMIGSLKWLFNYSKTYLKRPLQKKTKIGFQDRLSLNAGQKYCRMLQDSINTCNTFDLY